jgi:hypothetical protein
MSRTFLNDVNSKLDAGDTTGVDLIGTQVTVSAWIKTTSSARQAIAGKWEYQSGDKLSYVLETDGSSHVQFATGTNAGAFDLVTGVDLIPIGPAFVHVLGTKRGTGANLLKVFLSGKESGSATSTPTLDNTPSPFCIGVGNAAVGADQFPFVGSIADVAVWDVGLTNAEISYLASGGKPNNIRVGNLRGYWPLRDYGPSGVSKDVSRYRADAAMTGSVPLGPDFYLTTTLAIYIPVQASGVATGVAYTDSATVYLDLQPSGTDEYNPPCFLIGEGEANLRWTSGDDYLRWIGGDAKVRWEAHMILGTAQC